MLRILNQLPSGLITMQANQLADALGGPALIHIEGGRMPPLFVSVLLHGNEPTGWRAIARVLAANERRALPRSLDVFIGNVHAARQHLRRLEGQPDFNRIWDAEGLRQHPMAARMVDAIKARSPVMALDIHNTSGRNPLYACYHRREPEQLALARSFSDKVVLVETPSSLLANAMSAFTKAVTLECGPPGSVATEEQVAAFIETMLQTGEPLLANTLFPPEPVLAIAATVTVPEAVDVALDDPRCELSLLPDIDQHNFHSVAPGTPFARVRGTSRAMLHAVDEQGRDVSSDYFAREGDLIVAARPFIPSLLTLNVPIIRQDCLCYVMQPIAEHDAIGHARSGAGHDQQTTPLVGDGARDAMHQSRID